MLRINSKNIVSSYSFTDIIDFKSLLFQKLSELELIDTTKFHIDYLQIKFFDDKQFVKLFKENNFSEKNYYLTLFLSNKITKDIKVTIYDILLLLNSLNDNTLTLDYNTVHTFALFIVRYFREFSDKLKIFKDEQFLNAFQSNEIEEDAKSINCDIFYDDPLPDDIEKRIKLNSIQALYTLIKKINNQSKERAERNKKKLKYRFPEAFKKIRYHTNIISNMRFKLPNEKDINIYYYLITLLNIELFFSSITSIDFNLDFPYLYSHYYNIKSKHFECVDIDQFYTYKDNMQITQIIKDNKSFFELMLLIPLFINLFQNEFKRLKLNIPDSFTYELSHILKTTKIDHKDFNFLPNFDKEFTTIDISFNALNCSIFERIFVLINGSNAIKKLRLDLFPDDQYFSMYSMLKCLQDSSIAIPGETKLNSAYVIDNNELITGKLFAPFESNLEYFVFLIERKLHLLIELEFKFDLPGIFFLNDKFINTLHKFILSLLRMMVEKIVETKLIKFVIESTNFVFGTSKYPGINSFIQENINLTESKSIKEVILEIKFYQITAIHLLIPCRVEILHLGELDCDTLIAFTTIIPKLICLKELHMTFSNLYYSSPDKDKSQLINKMIEFKKSLTLKLVSLRILFDFDLLFYRKLCASIKSIWKTQRNMTHCLFISSDCEIQSNSIYYKESLSDFYTVAFTLIKHNQKRHGLLLNSNLLKILYGFLSNAAIIHTKVIQND